MKLLVPNYSCLQNRWLGGYRPQIPVLCVLCPQLNLLNPPEQNSWVRHWPYCRIPDGRWPSFKCRLNYQLSRLYAYLDLIAILLRCHPQIVQTSDIEQLFCLQFKDIYLNGTLLSSRPVSQAVFLQKHFISHHYIARHSQNPNDLDRIHYVTPLQSILRNTTAVRILVFRFWKATFSSPQMVLSSHFSLS